MERVNTLINKLQEQVSNNNSTKQILDTAQLLVAELSAVELPEEIGKVSVWMPSVYFSGTTITENIIAKEETAAVPMIAAITEESNEMIEVDPTPIAIQEVEKEIATLKPMQLILNEAINEIIEIAPTTIIEEQKTISVPDQPIEIAARKAAMIAVKPREIYNFNVLVEEDVSTNIPILNLHHKKETYELNDLIIDEKQSCNDVLKEDKKEVATKLVDMPVKDLRKAIGINDKYLYINELFQGDENMYERSVKTINNFSVLPEAEHWMKRELHTKLCWVENNETVKQFDNLVRRRFA
jgi:hypothetical protein